MLIYPLWLTKYHSGTGEQFFKGSMQSLGHEVDTCPLDLFGVEYDILYKLSKRKADLIFHIPYKENFRYEVMDSLTKSGYPTLCWNGDDEWLWDSDHKHNPKDIATFYKWNVTTCEAAIPKYNQIGVKPILAQWGYSAKDWKFKKLKRDIDVYFCGASTPERDKYLKRIPSLGINYSFDGPGYGHHSKLKNRCVAELGVDGKAIPGKVPFKVMLNKYLRSKISVSFLMGASGNKPYQQVKARAFEIPATGCFQLAYNCPELERFFEIGKEVDVFESEEEMLDKIQFYLEHDDIRERMAKRAMLRNLDYSYEAILKRVFKEIGL